MKLDTYFKIEDPINLYHAERHISSEPNIEFPRPPFPERVCPSALPREPFFIHEDEETMRLLVTTYSQDIMTNSGCVFFSVFLAFSPFL